MIHSMTAFASRNGENGQTRWAWDIRSVNGRGLDLRLRLPEGQDGLEQAVRAQVAKVLTRGNVSINLRLMQAETAEALQLDHSQLDVVLRALDAVQNRACDLGITLAQPNAADVLAQRGVLVAAVADDLSDRLVPLLVQDFAALLADFVAMRASEGAALQVIIAAHLTRIADLTDQAEQAAATRAVAQRAALAAALSRVTDHVDTVDPARIAQELALIAIKADVTEEIDRLRAHVAAARDLLGQAEPAGRKLDFLAQEFNREANTLCAKAQSGALTAIGLDLKASIEQMREQIQNME